MTSKRRRSGESVATSLDGYDASLKETPEHTADQRAIELSRREEVINIPTLPDEPINGGKYFFTVNPAEVESYTLPFFKFPARFFPLVPRWVIQHHSKPDDSVLDPFCGSGSALVESKILGRTSFGVDIDPLGRFLTKVKTTPIHPDRLDSAWKVLEKALSGTERRWNAKDMKKRDLDSEAMQDEIDRLGLNKYLPGFVNNPPYWFRNYVLLELAIMKKAVMELPSEHDGDCSDFFLGCFASTIRNSSNADPSAVSGLEYTKRMRQRDEEGRIVDPLRAFRKRVEARIEQMQSFYEACARNGVLETPARVLGEDIMELNKYLETIERAGDIDLIVTSPPYCTAIEYYRRHKLELVWLQEKTGLRTFEDVTKHSKHYIGRYTAAAGTLINDQGSDMLRYVLGSIEKLDHARAKAVSTYFYEMKEAFQQMNLALRKGGIAAIVIGDSTSKGIRVPTSDIYIDLASKTSLSLKTSFSYVIRNRIMQFPRKNRGGTIDFEKILVFQKS